jgi:Fe-S cluster assembly iron-binding protein IscA
MLTVTEAAGGHVGQILSQENFPEEVAIRLVYEGRGIGMQPDNERPGDATFEHDGRVVLLLDEQVSQLLANDTLDVEGAKLTLKASEGSP